MLTYNIDARVYLDGVHVGTIHQSKEDNLFRYWAKGEGLSGDPFPTLEECMKSLQ